MPRDRIFDPDEQEHLRDMHAKGVSIYKIAMIVNAGRETVKRELSRQSDTATYDAPSQQPSCLLSDNEMMALYFTEDYTAVLPACMCTA